MDSPVTGSPPERYIRSLQTPTCWSQVPARQEPPVGFAQPVTERSQRLPTKQLTCTLHARMTATNVPSPTGRRQDTGLKTQHVCKRRGQARDAGFYTATQVHNLTDGS